MPLFSRLVKRFGSLGGYRLVRSACKNKPRILMYHRFSSFPAKGWASKDCFEDQVKYIKRWYNPVTVSELVDRHHLGKNSSSDPHLVAISIDDGYRDFYDLAYPILKKHGVVSTLYVASGFVDRDIWLWPDKVSYLLDNIDGFKKEVRLGDISIESGILSDSKKAEIFRKVNDYFLTVTDEVKHKYIEAFYEFAGLSIPYNAPHKYRPVEWEQLREMQEYGVEIGGHTATHPSLGRVSTDQARFEIFECYKRLSEELGVEKRTFCYPNGMPNDFNEGIKKMVNDAGFVGAVKAFPDASGVSDRFAMGRHVSGDDMFQFYKSVSGMEFLGKYFNR